MTYNENFIPFGAQYYRAPTPLEDQWETDLESISRIGFNTIKIWAQWRWNNPSEGRYYFEDIDRLMDLAHTNGLKVIINAIFDVAPAWFYKKYPESVMVTSNGKKLEPQATACRQIGGAPGPCFHHKEGIYYRNLFMEELVKRYKNHPALYVWDLWNEPELTSAIEREPRQDNMVCYCPDSIKEFAEWLVKKYGDIKNLNRSWNRNYTHWDELEVPRNPHVFNDMIDWRLFFADTLTKELIRRVEIVKKYDTDHPVMVHIVPMPYFNMINACSDDYALARECDLFGNSVGSHPFAAAITTSSAPGKKVINSEIHAIGGTTYNLPAIPDFETIKKHIFIPLARGIKGFLFWQYRPERLGLESPAWGLTKMDGSETPWLKYCININNALQSYSNILSETMPLEAEIAVINGHKNQIFDWCVANSIDRHYNSVYGTFMALYRKNFNVDVISTDQINSKSLNKYKVIFYPFPYYMEDRVASELKSWVDKGGTLISEAFFGGIKESDGLHSYKIPGFGFDNVFEVDEGIAMTASEFMNAYSNDWSKEDKESDTSLFKVKRDLEYISAGESIEGYFFIEELIPSKAETLVITEEGRTISTICNYGKGKAIMIGTLAGYICSDKWESNTNRFIASLATIGGVKPKVETGNPYIRADLLVDDVQKNMLLVVTSELDREFAEEIKIHLELSKSAKLTNIITMEEVELICSKNAATCRIKLAPKGCEAFIITK